MSYVAALGSVAGALGMFLLGMLILTRALRELGANTLRSVLSRWVAGPSSGAAVGAATTAVLQSSSATTVATIGFVAAGMLTFSQAIGIVLGANLGTTVTGWMVALLGFKLKLGELVMPILALGVLTRLLAKGRLASSGEGIAGFALVFIAIAHLQDAMATFEGVLTPDVFPGDSFGGRLLLVGSGLLVTLVTQSSSAGVAAALAALHAETITFTQAACLIIGMDVGTTATAVIASVGASIAAKRTAVAHVTFNLLTASIAFALVSPFAHVWRLVDGGAEIGLVAFHSVFNVAGMMSIIPFADRFAALIERIVPDADGERELDPTLLDDAPLAVDAALRVLHASAAELLSSVRGFVTGELSRDDLDAPLMRATSVCARTNAYINEIASRKIPKAQQRRSVKALYIIDHIARLVERCSPPELPRQARSSPTTASVADDLAIALGDVRAWLDDPQDGPPRKQTKRIAKNMKRQRRALREELLGKAAAGDVDIEQAHAQLDELLWLNRVGYHAWRILRHAADAQP